jgi:hypothetical protein
MGVTAVDETRLRDQKVETYHPGELTRLPLFLLRKRLLLMHN